MNHLNRLARRHRWVVIAGSTLVGLVIGLGVGAAALVIGVYG